MSLLYTCSSCERTFSKKAYAKNCLKRHSKEKREEKRITKFYNDIVKSTFPENIDCSNELSLMNYFRHILNMLGLNIISYLEPKTSYYRTDKVSKLQLDRVEITLSEDRPKFLTKKNILFNKKIRLLKEYQSSQGIYLISEDFVSLAEDIFIHGKKNQLDKYILSISSAFSNNTSGLSLDISRRYMRSFSEYNIVFQIYEEFFPLILSKREEKSILDNLVSGPRLEAIKHINIEYKEWMIESIFSDISAISLFYEDKAIAEQLRILSAKQLEIRSALRDIEYEKTKEFSERFDFTKACIKYNLLKESVDRYNLIVSQISDGGSKVSMPSDASITKNNVFLEKMRDHSWLP